MNDGTLRLKMLPGEKWWGLCNAFGREMPFTESTAFECDLRLDNYAHQSLSLLCSDKGRAIWCPEPVGARIADGTIRLECDKEEIELVEHAGANLREAFRYASARWFPPSGGEPDLLYFSAPQCNTWIELTYHQNEHDILAYAQSMLDNGVPPGIFMIDDTWQLGYGTWEFDPRRFSDPKGMMAKLHAMGFKVLLWICPFVSMDSPAYRALLATGGFLAAGEDERGARRDRWCNDPAAVKWWNGKSALLDFTHPDGRRWFGDELARLRRDFGADGFKFDGGGVHFYAGCVGTEGASPTTIAFDPSVPPAAQSALYGAFALANPGSEYRNGFGFAGKPVIMRLHDKPHTWDALRRLIPDMLAAGFVGCPFICPDMIGGGEWTAFLPGSPFESELFLRSAQVHALCPMMQISASPWRVLAPEHQRIFKEIVALRQRFAPRFVELAKESARTGEPMMRNLEYVFPGRGYAEIKDEFLMGDDLLVAPVLEKGATSRRVVLPPGTWRADDGMLLEGPAELEVAAPLPRLPHFERVPRTNGRGLPRPDLVPGVVVRGHGVASGRAGDPRFPRGTIAMQIPFFRALGLDLSGLHPGTLNVDCAPLSFRPGPAARLFERVKWHPETPAETFSFARATLVRDGARYPAWIYWPHPETKPEHFQPGGVAEVIAPHVPDLATGDRVALETTPDQARWEPAPRG